MNSIPKLLCLLACTLLPQVRAAQPDNPQPLTDAQAKCRELLVTHVTSIQSDPKQARREIYYLLNIARQLHDSGDTVAAAKVFDQSETIVQGMDPKQQQQMFSTLFQYAKDTQQLELATKISKTYADPMRFNHGLALMKYAAGDDTALKALEAEEMTLFVGLELADAHIARGELEKAEEFAAGVKELPSNDPIDLHGLVLEKIAEAHWEAGRRDQALNAIDRAVQTAGNQFYTGITLQIKQKQMTGELNRGLRKLASRTAAYRGHMGRELTLNLIRHLIQADELAQIDTCIGHLTSTKDSDGAWHRVAVAYARRGDAKTAALIAKNVMDPSTQICARLDAGTELQKMKDHSGARALFKLADERLKAEPKLASPETEASTAKWLLATEDLANLKALLKMKRSSVDQLRLLDAAIKSISASKS